jgi:hypothetical protein
MVSYRGQKKASFASFSSTHHEQYFLKIHIINYSTDLFVKKAVTITAE